ncbi:MFS transporter [Ramlibacter tataouinensis]|uniref:Candidate transporter n=1 Tax=Ramlibacter tataouinensis (strain ATCC BAA-407 / DSM 14655 / LMG 21543 / TTB310) TaxID=365046 RepID=F5XWV8_RAMTT|nr:MFS transporter [Ramlibacter tataouinensis]AEG91719.1 Candidate transporter [Ramlibacter tataouinensis TTB310]
MLGFAATDLVLPAIPDLPAALQGTPAQAQHVLAAFAAGFAAGLLLFGELAARWSQRAVLGVALLLLAACSLAAAAADSLPRLVALRFVQGTAASAAAALAPGIIRTVFDERQALRAIGLQGSIESLVPALAPIAGAWLLAAGSWRTSFLVLGVLALATAVPVALLPGQAFPPAGAARHGGYLRLLRRRELVRHGLGQAFTLGGLLILVFGAPAVLVGAWGGPLSDFIRLQILGVASFIAAVQLSGPLCRRHGVEAVVLAGSLLSAAGCCALLAYALAGGRDALAVALLFIPVNLGLGLRGPPGFLLAIVAAQGDDSRAAALVVLATLLTTALGTVAVAPWIARGLVPLAAVAAAISLASVAVLRGLASRRP